MAETPLYKYVIVLSIRRHVQWLQSSDRMTLVMYVLNVATILMVEVVVGGSNSIVNTDQVSKISPLVCQVC